MRILTFLAALFWATASLAQTPAFLVPIHGPDDEADGIALAPSGVASIAGVARGGITLGSVAHPSRGQGDVFLASYDPTGAFLWSRIYGAAGDDNAFDMAVDVAGNLYLSGWFSGSVAFGAVTLTARGGTDMFVAKVSPAGTVLWAKSFGGTADDGGNEISVTDDGSIAVVGIGGGAFTVGSQTFPARGSRDVYIIRMDTGGSVLWTTPFAGAGNERARAVDIAETGEVCAGFTFRGSLNVTGLTMTALGDWDGAIACMNPQGAVQWSQHTGSAVGEDNVRGVGFAADGTIYASGVLTGSGRFHGATVPSDLAGGGDFVMRLSPTGTLLGYVSLTGEGAETGAELEMIDAGPVISGSADGRRTIRKDGALVTTLGPASGETGSYLLGLTLGLALDHFIAADPGPGGVARGGPVDASADGSRVVQVVRSSGPVTIGGLPLNGSAGTEPALVSHQPWPLNP